MANQQRPGPFVPPSDPSLNGESLVLAAMFAKQLQNDINGIKQKSHEVGGGLRVTDVDMSKVMPSHIMKAAGRQAPPQQHQQRPPQQAYVPPVPQPIQQPEPQLFIQPAPQPAPVAEQPYSDPNQLEFDLNKKVHYEDIHNKLLELEEKMIKINVKTQEILTFLEASNNKKKPKITNGTQAG
jgi:hypothetical protein